MSGWVAPAGRDLVTWTDEYHAGVVAEYHPRVWGRRPPPAAAARPCPCRWPLPPPAGRPLVVLVLAAVAGRWRRPRALRPAPPPPTKPWAAQERRVAARAQGGGGAGSEVRPPTPTHATEPTRAQRMRNGVLRYDGARTAAGGVTASQRPPSSSS
jgi:hypothetical protein